MTQFLQQQQLDTDSERGDETSEQQQPDQVACVTNILISTLILTELLLR